MLSLIFHLGKRRRRASICQINYAFILEDFSKVLFFRNHETFIRKSQCITVHKINSHLFNSTCNKAVAWGISIHLIGCHRRGVALSGTHLNIGQVHARLLTFRSTLCEPLTCRKDKVSSSSVVSSCKALTYGTELICDIITYYVILIVIELLCASVFSSINWSF